jgi:hypothetical protein
MTPAIISSPCSVGYWRQRMNCNESCRREALAALLAFATNGELNSAHDSCRTMVQRIPMVDSLRSARLLRRARAAVLVAAIALAGCEGRATFDLETAAPADPRILNVFVDIAGLELAGGGTQSIMFDDPVRVDLVQYLDGNVFRLFTDEDLDDGRYTGVRLLFSSDDRREHVVRRADGDFELALGESTAAEVGFTVDKDDSSRETVVLTLDLRQSLVFDADDRTYTLVPLVRAVRAEDAGQIVGVVSASCPAGATFAQGGAVYLFSGEDVTPDDRDGQGVEPYLTTRVGFDGTNGFTFRYVPAGNYTIALTCDGDDDDPASDDDLRFRATANVRVRAEESVTVNLR